LNKERDMLNNALGNKEHPRYTRGVSAVPWKVAFEDESLLLAFEDPVDVGLAIGQLCSHSYTFYSHEFQEPNLPRGWTFFDPIDLLGGSSGHGDGDRSLLGDVIGE